MAPCTPDILDLGKRALKNDTESRFKVAALKCCVEVVRSGPGNLGMSVGEVVKVAIRAMAERTGELKVGGAQMALCCLQHQPKQLFPFFDPLLAAVSKSVEDSRSPLFPALLASLVQLDLHPSSDLRQTSPSRRTGAGPPQTLMEAVGVLTGLMGKGGVTYETRVASGIAMKTLLVTMAPIACQTMTDLGVLMDSLLAIATKSLGNEVDNWRNLELICWISSTLVVDALSDSQRQQVLEYVLNKLSTLRNARSEELEGKRSTADYQATICLRLFEPLASCLHEATLKSYGEAVYQPLLDFMSSARHSKYTTRALAALTYRVPSSQANIIYKMIERSTVAHAEISSLKVGDVTRPMLVENMNNLYGYCLALGNVMKAISPSGIPEEYLRYALGTAKSLISGQYQPEHIEEQALFDTEGVPMECDYSRREGGWLMIEGIVRMRGSWIRSCLPQLISLWKLPFGDKTCLLDQPLSLIQLTFELRHKRAASCSLAAFIQHHFDLITPDIAKHLAHCLTNALKFLEPMGTDRLQRKRMLEENCSPNEILTLKSNIFKCLLELPLRTYVGSYVPLLHGICAELVSEKLTVLPSIYRSWLGADDLLLESPPTSLSQLLYEQSPQLYQESIYDTWLGLPLTHRFRFPLQHSSMLVSVLDNAVRLFAELFTSPVININNRLQLFKHLYGHVQTCNKQKDSVPGKVNKVVTILVACLACLRRLSDQDEVITDSELLSTLKAIVSALEGSAHTLTKRLQSLLSVQLCKASPDPSSTPTFLK